MVDGELRWVVSDIDPGCGCCSYVPVGYFWSKQEAERWVAEARDPSDYDIEEW